MERWQNRVAVVTGASSGIGFAIVKDFLKAGLVCVALARRKERLDDLRASLPADQQTRMHPVKCDISNLESVNQAFDWIEKNLGGVDVMVNNAGVYKSGQLLQHDPSAIAETLQTNVMGVVYCTQRAFKSMKSRNVDGHVVLLNSILGHSVFSGPPKTLPTLNIYPSSKHAITAMTEVLRQELREFGTKIKVTSISPGLVDTEMPPEEYRSFSMLKAEDVAGAVTYAVSTPPHVQIHEIIIKPMGEYF